jgi:hypothetical protein
LKVDPVQAAGLHAVERDGWRWTAREFGFAVAWPNVAIDVFIPPAVLEQLGEVVLNGRVFRRPGEYRVVSKAKAGRVEFVLDRALAPAAADGRELGVILRGVIAWP